MSESSGREWHFYVDDMIAFAENVITYTDGMYQVRKGFSVSGVYSGMVQLRGLLCQCYCKLLLRH